MVIIRKLTYKIFFFLRTPFFTLEKKNIPPLVIPKSITDDINKFSRIFSQISNIRCKQFVKVLLAAKLRYGPEVRDLKIAAIKKSYFFRKYKNRLFYSEMEPVIHLANDSLESLEIIETGNIHNDFDERGGIKGTHVIWIPATEYLYPGIVRKPWVTQFVTHVFCFIPNIYRFLFNFQKSIPILQTHKKGKLIEWNDSFLHGGIPNYSKQTAVALVIRVSCYYNNLTPYEILRKKVSISKANLKKESQVNLDFSEICFHIDEVMNKILLKQNQINDLWFIKTKNKFINLYEKTNLQGYKYILDFLEDREKLIDENSLGIE